MRTRLHSVQILDLIEYNPDDKEVTKEEVDEDRTPAREQTGSKAGNSPKKLGW